MRRFTLALALLATLAACGDDGKTAPRGAPVAPPPIPGATPPPAPAPVPSPLPSPAGPHSGPVSPPASGPSAASSWSTTRVGDSATWEIRVVGSASVTKLTWRATRVDAAGVRYAVQARTLDVEGATKSLVESEELHPIGGDARPDGVTETETLTVAGLPIAARRSTRPDGRTTIWLSDSVPFSGLVKSANSDVEQALVALHRGP